ncbi:MAG: PIN domain-containing protein [Thermodesulfobacteriota bacterium]
MKQPGKVYLIDTNIILRYLLEDHEEYSPRAKAFMMDISNGIKKAEILDVVIVESIYVMEKFYNIPKDEIVDKLSKIMNFPGVINPNRSEILNALLKYESLDIDIVDCILAAKSSSEKVVVSFDKDMERLKAVSEVL